MMLFSVCNEYIAILNYFIDILLIKIPDCDNSMHFFKNPFDNHNF